MGETKLDLEQLFNEPDVLEQELKDDGIFPNSKLKLLVYRKAVGDATDNTDTRSGQEPHPPCAADYKS